MADRDQMVHARQGADALPVSIAADVDPPHRMVITMGGQQLRGIDRESAAALRNAIDHVLGLLPDA